MSDTLFDPALVIKALVNQGYKNAQYALAELIDNSIQAGANIVHIYCFSEMVQLHERKSERITKIAVLDNGGGMESVTLGRAIRFGDGTKLGATKGLGKFGMGLPSASISQCDVTEVWSWQNGVDSALMTYLSLPQVKKGNGNVPTPAKKNIDPDVKKAASKFLERKGTLIVWRDLVRLKPVRFSALSTNLEFLIGRIYRNFIHDGRVSIVIHELFDGVEQSEKTVIPNDPLYLICPSTTPEPYSNKPLFVEFLDFPEPKRVINYFDDEAQVMKSGVVKVKITYIKPGTRSEYKTRTNIDAGSSPWGVHARDNVGYSICRDGRELYLDPAFTKPSTPTERWWGVEIDFEPSLDNLFKVPTNKQAALAVPDFHNFKWKNEAFEGESESAFYLRCEDEGDARVKLMKLFNDIDSALGTIRALLDRDTAGNRVGKLKPEREDPAFTGTKHAEEREASGHKGDAFGQPLPDAEEVKKAGKDAGMLQPEIDNAIRVLEKNQRFTFNIGKNDESESFFIVSPVQGFMMITINSSHIFYDQVWKPLFGEQPGADDGGTSIEERLEIAKNAFVKTLIAFARLEDEAKGDAEKIRQVRKDWGRMMKQFLPPIEYPELANNQISNNPPDDALVYGVPENH